MEQQSLPAGGTQQIVRNALSEATAGAEPGSAAADVLKQFIEASETSPLLCAETFFKGPLRDACLPAFSFISWQPQAVTALSYAMVFEYAFQDLVTASVQLLQMFLPRYKKNQFQQSRRAMAVLVRSMRYCLTSEGEQAVVTAVIALLALQVFVDGTVAVQALTKMALLGLEKKRDSPASKLATWGIVNLAQQDPVYRTAVEQAEGHDVLVHGLSMEPLGALTALAVIAEHDSEPVWKSLLELSGLEVLVRQAQSFELQSQTEVEELARIIEELQKLLQHPHQQEVVLQQLKSSNTLELLFVCAKANVAPVSQAALNCLVLIWQWYLRKSPSASFSDSQLSCFLGADLSDAASAQEQAISESSRSTAVGQHHLQQKQQQVQLTGIRRLSPHDSTASQIESHTRKLQQQQIQKQPNQMLSLHLQQGRRDTQEQQQKLWSVTPVVDFTGGEEGLSRAAHSPAPKQGSSGATGSGYPQLSETTSQKVDDWVGQPSRRSSSFFRRSFDAWSGIFNPSHRSSTSALGSPHKSAQPFDAPTNRQSCASFRRPPKPSKGSKLGPSPKQAKAYGNVNGISDAAAQPGRGQQASYRAQSSLPVMQTASPHSPVPACIQTPARSGATLRPNSSIAGQQQAYQSAQHANVPMSLVTANLAQDHARGGTLSHQGAAQQQQQALPPRAQQQGLAHTDGAESVTSASTSVREVRRRQPDALQYIQTWLNANPEGHWHPRGDHQGPLANEPSFSKGPVSVSTASNETLPRKGKLLSRSYTQERHFGPQSLLSTQPLFKLAPSFIEASFTDMPDPSDANPRHPAVTRPPTAAADSPTADHGAGTPGTPTAAFRPATAGASPNAAAGQIPTAAAGHATAASPSQATTYPSARQHTGLPPPSPAGVGRQPPPPAGVGRQPSTAVVGPQTPEQKRPTQRVLAHSPMPVTQVTPPSKVPNGKLPMHQQASAEAPSTPTKNAASEAWSCQHPSVMKQHNDAWRAPSVDWSASGSSLLTAPRPESMATRASSSIGSTQVSVDNVSKASFGSQPVSHVIPSAKQDWGVHQTPQRAMPPTPRRVQDTGTAKAKKTGWQKFAAWFAE